MSSEVWHVVPENEITPADCACPRAECGRVVDPGYKPDCPMHGAANEAVRWRHKPETCPALPTADDETAALKAELKRRHEVCHAIGLTLAGTPGVTLPLAQWCGHHGWADVMPDSARDQAGQRARAELAQLILDLNGALSHLDNTLTKDTKT